MKKILFAASEAVPFMKTGGLADVTGSLPKYFDKKNYEVGSFFQNMSAWKNGGKDSFIFYAHFM